MRPIVIICVFILFLSLLPACKSDPKVVRDKYYASGQKYLENKKYEEAAIEFRNALRADNGHIPSYLGMAKAFQQLGDHKNAIAVYQQVVRLDGKNVEARLQLGQYLIAAGVREPALFKQVQEMAEAILAVDPANVEGLVLFGNALAGQNNVDQSIQALQKAVSLDPVNLKATLNLGAAQLRKNETEKAEATFKGALAKHPDSTQAHIALAVFYVSSKRLMEAEAEYKKAFDMAPGDAMCLNSLAGFYLSANRNTEAENVFKEATAREPKAREPRWGLASFYAQRGMIDKSLEALNEVLKLNPQDSQAHLRMAELYLSQKNDVKAEQSVRSVLARDNGNAEAHYLLGSVLRIRGQAEKALAEFEIAIKANGTLLQPHVERANLLLGRGDLEGAQSELNTAFQLDKSNVLTLGALAKVYALQQKPTDALPMAEQVLTVMPNNEDALAARGDALRMQGKLSESKKDFQKLCELAPGNAVYWHRLGTIAALQNDSAAALAHFRKAVELDPTFVSAINDILYFHIRSKQFDVALAELERVSKPSTPQDEVHRLRGQVYMENGDQGAAESEFRKAIEVNPQNYQAYIILGQMSLQRNNMPQALKEVDQLIGANQKFAPGFLLKGYYLQVANDTSGAMTNYRKVLELDPGNPIAANNLAWLLCESNTNLDEALSLARAARKKVPESPEFADTLGWIYYKQKNSILAVDQLLFSVNSRPKPSAENYYHLGMAYFAKGDMSHAKESLRKSLDLKSNFPGAEEARRILKQLVSCVSRPGVKQVFLCQSMIGFQSYYANLGISA